MILFIKFIFSIENPNSELACSNVNLLSFSVWINVSSINLFCSES